MANNKNKDKRTNTQKKTFSLATTAQTVFSKDSKLKRFQSKPEKSQNPQCPGCQ